MWAIPRMTYYPEILGLCLAGTPSCDRSVAMTWTLAACRNQLKLHHCHQSPVYHKVLHRDFLGLR